jgi:hypothetical protein
VHIYISLNGVVADLEEESMYRLLMTCMFECGRGESDCSSAWLMSCMRERGMSVSNCSSTWPIVPSPNIPILPVTPSRGLNTMYFISYYFVYYSPIHYVLHRRGRLNCIFINKRAT